MTRKNLFLLSVLLLSSVAVMHAQGGCADSPEAPTDILMLVGATGLYFGNRLRGKFSPRSRLPLMLQAACASAPHTGPAVDRSSWFARRRSEFLSRSRGA